MSRYISLDWLNAHANYICERGRKDISRIIYADKLNAAPTIDIVRCKECKWFDDEDYGEPTRYCTWHESVIDADDFCSYGSRSEKPNNSKEGSK